MQDKCNADKKQNHAKICIKVFNFWRFNMYILRDLWRGNTTPSERYICAGTEYQKVLHKLCEETELFLKDLSSEKRKHYEELEKCK